MTPTVERRAKALELAIEWWARTERPYWSGVQGMPPPRPSHDHDDVLATAEAFEKFLASGKVDG